MKHVIYQKIETFIRVGLSMLTELKVSSSACQSLFYRPEHNAKSGNHEIKS